MPTKISRKQILNQELSAVNTNNAFPQETEPVPEWATEAWDEVVQERKGKEKYIHYLRYAPHPSSKKMRRGYCYATEPGNHLTQRR